MKLPVVKSDVNGVRPVQGSVEPYSVEPYTATWPQKVGDCESATPENGVDDCRWTSQEKDIILTILPEFTRVAVSHFCILFQSFSFI